MVSGRGPNPARTPGTASRRTSRGRGPAVRGDPRPGATGVGPGRFSLRPHPPLDFDLTLQRYRLWGEDPANLYRDGAFYRVARLGGAAVPFRLTAAGSPDRPRLTVTFDGPDTVATRRALTAEVHRLLGLDADLTGFYAQVAEDPVLGPLVPRLRGLRPALASNAFEMLVGAIAAQQVNLAFAFATRARLVRALGEPFRFDGVTVHAFPSPAAVAGADVTTLRAMQFSTRKAEYLIGLGQAVADRTLDLAGLTHAADHEVIARLTAVRGLGRWTAEWFLARGLGRPDICPAEDLGVRRAVEALCYHGRACDPARVRRRVLGWRPYRSLAVHYLLAGARLARGAASGGGT
ncbi:MAG TPA: AlkA N-terminal domain-containing protein [Methylomirabilota bacterium]|jgi:DNA-3-methyladenine glycosylase II|nr:AlkA N-terminal domain-containing protein [Methylomirabilota bacterium]